MSKQSKIKHERLLNKAESLFLKYGFKAVSMDQIAKEAGISKMTIYKHYPSKEDLFIAVLIHMTDYHVEKIEAEIERQSHTMEKIECMYSYSMKNISVVPDFVIKEIMERTTVLEAISSYKQKWTLSLWRRLLEDGLEKGELRPLDVEFTATLLMNLPMAFMHTDYYSSPEKISQLTENFYDFIKYGILGKVDNAPKARDEEVLSHEKDPHEN